MKSDYKGKGEGEKEDAQIVPLHFLNTDTFFFTFSSIIMVIIYP